MDESLAALSDPRLDLASMTAEAFTLIRLILASDSPPAAKCAGVWDVLAELAPPPGPGAWAPPIGPIPAGTTPGEIARIIAHKLACHPAPATSLLERFAGEALHVKTACAGERPARDGERRRLRAAPGETVHASDGELVTGHGVHVATVQLAVIPARLPPDIINHLGGEVPFGTLAAPHGLRRRARAATATGEDPAVRSTALLEVGGEPVGIAAEWISREFVEHVAGRLGEAPYMCARATRRDHARPAAAAAMPRAIRRGTTSSMQCQANPCSSRYAAGSGWLSRNH